MAGLGFSGFSSVCSSVIDSKRGWKILFEIWKLEILRCINQKIWHQHQGSENLSKQVSQILIWGNDDLDLPGERWKSVSTEGQEDTTWWKDA
ncbi:hypothetical protein FH972_010903 [Carpinus fangiana]|uniref:Uncharacterized protein n=1 Tax=Carpinus fangiana TaxID=176857 RepID=A0A660KRF6_9ROSI|nr:hypothetical protein FH972_010903 [Carpinus fangiana]